MIHRPLQQASSFSWFPSAALTVHRYRTGSGWNKSRHCRSTTGCAIPVVPQPWETSHRFVTSSSSSALQMVVTKSGGRAIRSQRQFEIEVLHQIEVSHNLVGDNDDIMGLLKEKSSNEEGAGQVFQPSKTPTLVFFSAPWCGPCRLSNPVVKEIIKQFVPRIDVVEVCTDDLPEIAEEAGVTSIPTIQIYHEGKLLDTIVGCVAKNVLGNAVNKILEDLGLDASENFESGQNVDDRR